MWCMPWMPRSTKCSLSAPQTEYSPCPPNVASTIQAPTRAAKRAGPASGANLRQWPRSPSQASTTRAMPSGSSIMTISDWAMAQGLTEAPASKRGSIKGR